MHNQQAAARLFNEGLAHHRANRLQDARRCYEQGLALNPLEADAHFLLGQLLFATGHPADAERVLRQALQLKPAEARYLHELGVGLFNAGSFDKAQCAFEQALGAEPDNPAFRYALAMVLEQQNLYAPAIGHWQSLAKVPEFAGQADEHLARLYLADGHTENALAILNRIIQKSPGNAQALSQRADVYERQGDLEKALDNRHQAATLMPENALFAGQLALTLMAAGHIDEALAQFDHSVQLAPQNGQLHFNRGLAYERAGQRELAGEALGLAIQYTQEPHARARALTSLANLHTDLGEHGEAQLCYQQAIELMPEDPVAHFNLGMLHLDQSRRQEAVGCFTVAHRHDPDNGLIAAHLAFQQMHLCQWDGLDDLTQHIAHAIEQNSADIPPFIVLSLPYTTAKLQYQCAQNHSGRFGTVPTQAKPLPHAPHARVRVGYLSSDFKNHATAYLMIEMLEAHNRERFEFFALSYGVNDHSDMRYRLERTVEHFIDLQGLAETVAVDVISKLELDILVDLKGYTQENCSHWLRYRLAPIQINWLGYPGTLGAPWVDYLIADAVVAPLAHQPMYSEKLLHLPGSYQPVARNRPCAPRASRHDEQLPEEALVLCSLNQTYKISPEIFACWLRVLQHIPQAVLWLWASNPWAEERLCQQAQAVGVDPKRLVFAQGKSQPEHLARIHLADLAIDTFPCNGHTTTSDALWAGVPVITLQGSAFASRVASSLLAASGFSSLITTSLTEYEECILRFCRDADWRRSLRQQAQTLRSESAFFDARCFAEKLEALFIELDERHRADMVG